MWTDQSGTGNNFATGLCAASPTYVSSQLNSLPVLRFVNASTQCLYHAGSATLQPTAGVSVFVVGKKSLAQQGNFFFIGGSTGVPYTDGYGLVINAAGTNAGFFVNDQATHTAEAALALGTYTIMEGRYSKALATIAYYKNGVSSATAAHALDIDWSFGIQPMYIGDDANNDGTGSLQGDIAEILIYSRALSNSEMATVESYLATRYGL